MSLLNVSVPTKAQLVAGVERVIAVFLVAGYGFWQVASVKFSTATGHGLVLAGATAVYQLVKSTLTSL